MQKQIVGKVTMIILIAICLSLIGAAAGRIYYELAIAHNNFFAKILLQIVIWLGEG